MNAALAEANFLWPAAAIFFALALVVLAIYGLRRFRASEKLVAEMRGQRDAIAELQRELEDRVKAERQTLFNSMVEGVVLLDPSGRIQLVNQSLEKQFGLSVDVRGQTLSEAFRRPELTQLLARLDTERKVLSC